MIRMLLLLKGTIMWPRAVCWRLLALGQASRAHLGIDWLTILDRSGQQREKAKRLETHFIPLSDLSNRVRPGERNVGVVPDQLGKAGLGLGEAGVVAAVRQLRVVYEDDLNAAGIVACSGG